MWLKVLGLLLNVGFYFGDIGVDVLLGRQQYEKAFPEHKFGGKLTS